jgi:hypothetical protein
MDDSKILDGLAKMSEASKFFLFDSFHHIGEEIKYKIASELFGEELKKIDTTEADHKALAKVSDKISGDVKKIIKFDGYVISRVTQDKMSDAWMKAQLDANYTSIKFPKNTELSGQDLLGHITNFAFFVESLTNRHLLLLRVNEKMDDFTFNSLDKASVPNKIIYCLKDEISKKKLNPIRLNLLFKLRNFAVHFTLDNSTSFKVTIEQLIQIWSESSKLCDLFQKKEKIKDINLRDMVDSLVDEFQTKFVK